jgi:hypothetical protein
MSYARFSYASVYVFHNSNNQLECCSCSIEPTRLFLTTFRSQMIAHLRKHEEEGGDVAGVPERLEDEIAGIGDDVTDEIGRHAVR